MSDTICDHTSVGMLVWKDDKLLLIERKKFPFGFAPPAGHVDGDPSFEVSAKRELKEEVGLEAQNLKLVWEGRKENTCRRVDGTWHYWKIYKTTATGDLSSNVEETKQTGWFAKEEIATLSQKTKDYLEGKISEEEWQKSPGIETVWYEFFNDLNQQPYKPLL